MNKIPRIDVDYRTCWLCKMRFNKQVFRDRHENKKHPRPALYYNPSTRQYTISGGMKVACILRQWKLLDKKERDESYLLLKLLEKETKARLHYEPDFDNVWLERKQ